MFRCEHMPNHTIRQYNLKLLVIHGSMRKGNTYCLTQKILYALKANQDVFVDEIHTASIQLPFCLSCHQCFMKGEHVCPHYAIVHTIAEKIEAADAIILSGSVYSMHLNAAMKNVIDHLSYYFHRPRLFNKKGMVIVTTAGGCEKTVSKYLRTVLQSWGVNSVMSVTEKVQTETFELNEKQKQRIYDMAFSFYNTILHNKIRSPTMYMIAVYNVFRGMSSAKSIVSEYDSEYWTSSGLNTQTYPIKHNAIKKWFGNFVCKIMRSAINKNAEKQETPYEKSIS